MKLFQKLFGLFGSKKAEAPKAELPANAVMNQLVMKNPPKKVDQYLKDGTWVQTFPSVRAAARAVGIHSYHISNCCAGKQRTAGGYRWRYADGKRQ